MNLDTEPVHTGVGRPHPSLPQPVVPGALVHGVLAAASSVAGSADRALAGHSLTVREHAVLSRLAAAGRDAPDAAGLALLSLCERGLVRYRGGGQAGAATVELTPAGAGRLAQADAALHQVEVRMHSHLATWGPLAVQQMLAELIESTSIRGEVGVTIDPGTGAGTG